jgi:site-specific DNA-methyltransferase (adenine-specific)
MIACWELGFDFVGCELDKNYYDAAVNRFKEHVTAHPKLFTPKQLTNIQLTID